MKPFAYAAVVGALLLVGCSSSGEQTVSKPELPVLSGANIVTVEAQVGEVRVTGRGGVTFGEECIMDVMLRVEDGRSLEGTPVDGEYRFARREGGRTVVSKNGGSWQAFSAGELKTPLLLLPTTISPRPLAGYGDFMCAMAVVNDIADVNSDGTLTWDAERAESISKKSQTAYFDEVIAATGLPAGEQQCYRDFVKSSIAGADLLKNFNSDAAGSVVRLTRDGENTVYEHSVTRADGEIVRLERLTFEPTRWTVPGLDATKVDVEALRLDADRLKSAKTGC
jgi:hypothetical protein